MSIKVLSFDLDDTLWEVRPVLIAAEKRVSAFLLQHCPDLFDRFSFAEVNERRIALFKQRPDLTHQISQLRIESVKELLCEYGLDVARASALSNEAFEVFIEARHKVSYFDQVPELLSSLAKNYSLAALTNGNADVKRLSIGASFDLSIKAEDINASKPDAAMFEDALAHFAIKPEEMLHIGDNPEHDVLGAQRLGIKTVWVNASNEAWSEPYLPDAQVHRVTELPGLLARLAQSS